MSFEVVRSFPHDTLAFTQGLLVHNGFFYESTGKYGFSSLRKVQINTGEVLQKHDLAPGIFAEGLAFANEKFIQLSWRSQTGFVYQEDNFAVLSTFQYNREGWGLTFDGQDLIMSDGSDSLFYWDSESFSEKRAVAITSSGEPVFRLNELEYINGQIWANIWKSDSIAIINPDEGTVVSWLNLQGILSENESTFSADVLNGIAWDAVNNAIFVTGKYWPKVYQITIF